MIHKKYPWDSRFITVSCLLLSHCLKLICLRCTYSTGRVLGLFFMSEMASKETFSVSLCQAVENLSNATEVACCRQWVSGYSSVACHAVFTTREKNGLQRCLPTGNLISMYVPLVMSQRFKSVPYYAAQI